MIITDITQIDNMAERMFGHIPNLITIDMNDYNRIKSSSTYLNATSIKLPLLVNSGINAFIDAVAGFSKKGARKVLLQICGVSSSLEVHNIKFNEMCIILRIIEEHFGKVDIIWGLSDRKTTETYGYEINIIVGYK